MQIPLASKEARAKQTTEWLEKYRGRFEEILARINKGRDKLTAEEITAVDAASRMIPTSGLWNALLWLLLHYPVPKSPFDEIMIDQDEWEISRHWPKPGDPPASLEYLHDVHIDGAFAHITNLNNFPIDIPHASSSKQPYDLKILSELRDFVQTIAKEEWTLKYKTGGIIAAFGHVVHVVVDKIKKELNYEVLSLEIHLQPYYGAPAFPLHLDFFRPKGTQEVIGAEVKASHPSRPLANQQREQSSRFVVAFDLDMGVSGALSFVKVPSPAPRYGVATMREVGRWPAETLIPHLVNSSLGVASYAFFLATFSEERSLGRVFTKDELRTKNRLFFGWLERWFKLGGQELPQEGQSWLAAMIAIGGMKGLETRRQNLQEPTRELALRRPGLSFKRPLTLVLSRLVNCINFLLNRLDRPAVFKGKSDTRTRAREIIEFINNDKDLEWNCDPLNLFRPSILLSGVCETGTGAALLRISLPQLFDFEDCTAFGIPAIVTKANPGVPSSFRELHCPGRRELSGGERRERWEKDPENVIIEPPSAFFTFARKRKVEIELEFGTEEMNLLDPFFLQEEWEEMTDLQKTDVFLPSSTERLRYRDQVTKRYPFA